MKIGLLDLDYNYSFPNIPLMKISAGCKRDGHAVEWYDGISHYDAVYIAKVFSRTPDYAYPIDADRVYYGGTGYQIRIVNGKEVYCNDAFGKKDFIAELPPGTEHIYPDYSLYPELTRDTAYGFLTRGCPRKCMFCHVSSKEGYTSTKVADLAEFWNGQKNIVLCDPNILACKEWKNLLQQLIDSRANIDFTQGLDIRMMNEEKADMISRCKIKQIHFAWDRYEDKHLILSKFEQFRKVWERRNKWNERGQIVYTLVNFNTTKEQDLERIYELRELGFWAYVMIYDKEHCTDRFYKDLARWVNNRYIFAQCKRFEDYNRI